MAVTPLPYYGAKSNIAREIIATFPDHHHYVEPFAGSLTVLLAKPRSACVTVNDLDGDLVTFWRVLRDDPDGLMRVCEMTPYSRAEHTMCRDEPRDGLPDLEIARRVWANLVQAHAGDARAGWKRMIDTRAVNAAQRNPRFISRMPDAARRLSGVVLEARDALEVITDYGASPDALLYVDPPYAAETRNGTGYRHEMGDESAHSALAAALNATQAYVVLSGYRSTLYDALYADWERIDMSARIDGGDTRTESLWLNFDRNDRLF